MTKLREFVKTIGPMSLRQIVKDYNRFENKGSIGESSLRYWTELFMKRQGLDDSYVTMYMQLLAFECFRRFAVEADADLNLESEEL